MLTFPEYLDWLYAKIKEADFGKTRWPYKPVEESYRPTLFGLPSINPNKKYGKGLFGGGMWSYLDLTPEQAESLVTNATTSEEEDTLKAFRSAMDHFHLDANIFRTKRRWIDAGLTLTFWGLVIGMWYRLWQFAPLDYARLTSEGDGLSPLTRLPLMIGGFLALYGPGILRHRLGTLATAGLVGVVSAFLAFLVGQRDLLGVGTLTDGAKFYIWAMLMYLAASGVGLLYNEIASRLRRSAALDFVKATLRPLILLESLKLRKLIKNERELRSPAYVELTEYQQSRSNRSQISRSAGRLAVLYDFWRHQHERQFGLKRNKNVLPNSPEGNRLRRIAFDVLVDGTSLKVVDETSEKYLIAAVTGEREKLPRDPVIPVKATSRLLELGVFAVLMAVYFSIPYISEMDGPPRTTYLINGGTLVASLLINLFRSSSSESLEKSVQLVGKQLAEHYSAPPNSTVLAAHESNGRSVSSQAEPLDSELKT